VERHRFKNFKVFDADFNILYEIRDKGTSLEKNKILFVQPIMVVVKLYEPSLKNDFFLKVKI
jgi:hypothetical protein